MVNLFWENHMPAFSKEELYIKLHNEGKVALHGTEVTEQLLQELEDNKDKAEGFVSSTGLEFTQESAKNILELFDINPFATGIATGAQWQKRISDMYQTMKNLSTKEVLDLEEAERVYNIYSELSACFGNFNQPGKNIMEKNFKNNIDPDLYEELFALGYTTIKIFDEIEKKAQKAIA